MECGAWDGFEMSNTAELLQNRGWSGVLIEEYLPNFTELMKNRKAFPKAICLKENISVENGFDQVLAKTPIPTRFDLLVLDIDGSEYWAWLEMKHYVPRVVVIDINPSFGKDYAFIPRRGVALIGASIGQWSPSQSR